MNKLKKAFSIAEAVVLLVVVAVGIAASTPIISRKIANVQESGATIGGGGHGRYEVFVKEIVTFDNKNDIPDKTPSDNAFEKVNSGAGDGITIYERKDDATFEAITGSAPVTDGSKKSTLYEEFSDATPSVVKDGVVHKAKIKKGNNTIEVEIGNKYVYEKDSVTYERGKLTFSGTNPKIPKFEKYTETTKKFNNSKNRIIEGNYTKLYKEKNSSHGNYWLIKAENITDFKGKVTPIPWERIISGNNPIKDDPITPTINPQTNDEEYITTFTPPQNAKNLVFHAVGGGGAGGLPEKKDNNYLIKGKSTTNSEVQNIKKILEARLKKVHPGYTGTLVAVVNSQTPINQKTRPIGGDPWIILNTYDGTISGKIDIRQGGVYPHEILDYTKDLHTQTQVGLVYDMPSWATWNTLDVNQNRNAFCIGGKAQGGVGGKGGDYTWQTNGDGDTSGELSGDIKSFAIRRKLTGHNDARGYYYNEELVYDECPYTVYDYYNIDAYGNCLLTGYSRCATQRCCYKTGSNKYIKKRTCNVEGFDSTYFTKISDLNVETTGKCSGGLATNASSCGKFQYYRNSRKVNRLYPGHSGGNPGGVAIAASRISGPQNDVAYDCYGGSGEAGADTTFYHKVDGSIFNFPLAYGQPGKTCYVVVNGKMAISTGGMGGAPCLQNQIVMDADFNKAGEVIEQMTEEFGSAYAGEQAAHSAVDHKFNKYWSSKGYFNYVNDGLQKHYVMTEESQASMKSAAQFAEVQKYQTTSANGNNNSVLLNPDWASKAQNKCNSCGGSPGANGISYNAIDGACNGHLKGIGFGGPYNHIYYWTIPFSMNYLTYGESGEAGEYASTKVSEVSEPLKIYLGKGGNWYANGALDVSSKTNAQQRKGPDGEATTIDMGNTRILTAKGGKGGRGNFQTDRYDLCFTEPAQTNKTCSNPNPNSSEIPNTTNCCRGNELSKSTKDIHATSIKYSAFDDVKALAKNSRVIGLGLGRGGEGAGTNSGKDELGGTRYVVNISASGGPYSPVLQETSAQGATNSNLYTNHYLEPSALNFKGGDGAVIITW